MRLEYLYDKNPSGFLPVFKSVKEGYTGGIDPLVHLPKLRAWAAVTSHKSMHNMNYNVHFSRSNFFIILEYYSIIQFYN